MSYNSRQYRPPASQRRKPAPEIELDSECTCYDPECTCFDYIPGDPGCIGQPMTEADWKAAKPAIVLADLRRKQRNERSF